MIGGYILKNIFNVFMFNNFHFKDFYIFLYANLYNFYIFFVIFHLSRNIFHV